jgi:glucosamine 6-phosphate synthetase-like amidotransferase/phosphosugar isomerase protein
MCGIAGYSIHIDSSARRTLAAQALLAGIAERGADAVGYGHRGADPAVTVHKQRTGASALLEAVVLPESTTQALIHVRDYTKGHPSIEANNHPIRHGSVVGVHNGIIRNDDELFARFGWERQEPEMTVDSEIIFAIAEAHPSKASALEVMYGAMATAWIDERDAETMVLARGVGRPLWIGTARREVFFASTRATLELVERALRLGLRKREVGEGRLLRLAAGKVVAEERWRPDRSYEERSALPAVRAPHEGAHCRERLAAIAAWA